MSRAGAGLTLSTERPVGVPGFTVRSGRSVDLGLLTARVYSNQEDFGGYAFFPRSTDIGTGTGADTGREPDFELYCVDLDRDPVDRDLLEAAGDRTLRAKRFRTGYYRGPYYGEPAHLITRGRRFHVFGRSLEKLVWPYFVKRFLSDFAAGTDHLNMKAAGIAAPGGGPATLLVGQSGGGKTTFLTQACLAGYDFLTNTHTLYRDGTAHGVPTAMRVRRDAYFAEVIDRQQLPPYLDLPGEYLAGAEQLFDGRTVDSAEVLNVVILNARDAPGPAGLRRISPDTALAFLDQFGFATSTYGMKEDLAAHFDGDLEAYAAHYLAAKGQLHQLTRTARCYVAQVDMLDPAVRDATLTELHG
ncbi:FomB family phosphonate monophosphate kinase [Kitasatospora sp. NPDC051853]|uniref:FomB family phosphonate monophosphate kinase n=1 Tax=Kitasatospora sp. NPDC051853 TaxID=3364058 RepID=UPI0037B3341B